MHLTTTAYCPACAAKRTAPRTSSELHHCNGTSALRWTCSGCARTWLSQLEPDEVTALRAACYPETWVAANADQWWTVQRHAVWALTVDLASVLPDEALAAERATYTRTPPSGFLAAPARDITWPTTRTRLGAYINAQWRGRRGCATCGGPRELNHVGQCLRCVAAGPSSSEPA